MDTRTKICRGADAGARLNALPSPVMLVSGYFDPLLAAHALRLRAAKGGSGALAVIVLDPPRPILPLSARAELVAALAAVDLVLLSDGVTTLPEPTIRFEAEDHESAADLERRIARAH